MTGCGILIRNLSFCLSTVSKNHPYTLYPGRRETIVSLATYRHLILTVLSPISLTKTKNFPAGSFLRTTYRRPKRI